MTLTQYLSSHARRRGDKRCHTHTAFENSVTPLHIDDASELQRTLYAHVCRRGQDLSKGANAITEKVPLKGRFRLFLDIDFKIESVETFLNEHDKTQLIDELRKIPKYVRAVMQKNTGTTTGDDGNRLKMITATRLPYKIHYHFPEIIVSETEAKRICELIKSELQQFPLYDANAIDTSVYRSGLRMLWCHKGAMMNAEKMKSELESHEKMFGDGSWSAIYEVTDEITWEKAEGKSLEDLVATSIIAGDDAKITEFRFDKAKSPVSRKGKAPAIMSTTTDMKEHLATHLEQICSIPASDIRTDEKILRGGKLVIPTRHRRCLLANREHNSNQQYLVVTKDFLERRCHDDECSGKISYPVEAQEVKSAIQEVLKEVSEDESASEITSIQELPKVQDRLTTFREVLTRPLGNKTEVAEVLKMNLVPANEKMTSMGYWTCTLPQNRYCPVCQSTHDRAENFIQVSPLGHRGIGCNLRHGEFYPDPLSTVPQQTVNILFNNTFNVNVTTCNQVEIHDFGSYDQFPRVHDDDRLNRLCYASLEGGTGSVAEYAQAQTHGQYIYQDGIWYSYEETSWYPNVKPDELFRKTLADVYMQLRSHFKTSKQLKWLSELISDLRTLNKRKQYIEELERVIHKSRERFPLDEQANLLGFKNRVFDSNTGFLGPHRPDNYLTSVLDYDVPEEDLTMQQEINAFFESIMSNKAERDFLWLMLALHLRGNNAHNIAMVWSGSGGNGKTILARLMKETFQQYYEGHPGTYLTTERPSPERPSPLMVSQRLIRCVFAQEPEAGKKCNTAFLKFITGGDQVKARNNCANDYVEYYPRFLITMSCNEIPLFDGAAGEIRGLWRRVKIFKFRSEFVDEPTLPHHRKRDGDLEEKVKTWAPQFMLMLIQKYRQYLAQGKVFTVPREVEQHIEEQKEENNPMESWLREHLIVKEGSKIHYHRFDKAFQKWQVDNQVQTKIPRTGFVDMLRSFGHQVSNANEKIRDERCCENTFRYVEGVDVKEC